jgi:hypothetical protein
MLIGLRPQNFPMELEVDFLVQYILKNFAQHTNAEIRLAFDLAIAGRLDLDPKEVPCYENFHAGYFGRIMTAYVGWAKQTYKLLPDKSKPAKEYRAAQQEADWQLDLRLQWAHYLLKQVNKFPCMLNLRRREA